MQIFSRHLSRPYTILFMVEPFLCYTLSGVDGLCLWEDFVRKKVSKVKFIADRAFDGTSCNSVRQKAV